MKKEPYIDDALIEYLDSIYIDRYPEPEVSERQLWINRGKIEVVRHLKRLREIQRNNLLGT